MKETINKMRQRLLEPKEEIDIKDIFSTIAKNLQISAKELADCYRLETGGQCDVAELARVFQKDIFSPYGSLTRLYLNDFGRVSVNLVPYGIVGVYVAQTISLKNYVEIVKVCLETRNSLILSPGIYSKTLELLVMLINDVLAQTTEFNQIVLTPVNLMQENLDLLVYVGKKDKFELLDFDGEKKYVGVGNSELYVHETLDKKLIKYAQTHGVKIYYPEDDVISKINKEGANYCSAIMSSNKQAIRQFISEIKSSYVLVNTSPTVMDSLNLFPEDLLKRQNTIIFE